MKLRLFKELRKSFSNALHLLNNQKLELRMYTWFNNRVEMFCGEFGWASWATTWASTLHGTQEESAGVGLRCAVEQAWGEVEDNVDVAGSDACIQWKKT